MRRRTSSVTVFCLLLVFFFSLVAIAGITEEPSKITSVRIVSLKVEEEAKPAEKPVTPARPPRGAPPAPPAQPAPAAQESSEPKKPASVTFTLSIEGVNLPSKIEKGDVQLYTEDPAQSVEVKEIVSANGKEILVKATAQAKTKIKRIQVKGVPSAQDFTISISENPPKPKTAKFDMKLEHDKNKQFPDVHTVILSKSGGDGDGFDLRTTRMAVDLQPSGATDIVMTPRSAEQLDLRFFAPADYEPTGARVTVYDGSDLETRKVSAIGETKKEPTDPNKPKVNNTRIVFINRSHGTGRLRIYGEGFGDFDPPPYQVDEYLWNCLEQFHIRGTNRYALWTQQREFEDLDERLRACKSMLDGGYRDDVQKDVNEAGCALEGKGYKKIGSDTSECNISKVEKNRQGEINGEEEPQIKKRLEDTKVNLADFLHPEAGQGAGDQKKSDQVAVKHDEPAVTPGVESEKKSPWNAWKSWETKVRDAVNVSIQSRNSDIQVERVEIININDKMMDVYFEFTRNRGFSVPFRLESSSLTIRKDVQKTLQTVTGDKVTATVSGPKSQVYTADYQIEPKRDANLTYKYTILANASANSLLGKGVADNFYVIQLSVVNNSDKKVAIPLASVQAEVEWVRGQGSSKTRTEKLLFRKAKPSRNNVAVWQGPPTMAPIPLGAVSSSFEAYQKAKGFRAHLFNGLDAATIMATALVPFTGPSFKDAEVFFSGGFIPGVRKGLGDLSSQQLQNLTSLSWESSETVPAQGGSIAKYIYIQKRSQQFTSDKHTSAASVPSVITSQIAAILGLEVTGFEIKESEAKTATPEPKPSTDTSKESSSDQKPPSTPSNPSTPTTPPATGSGKNKK